VGAVSTGFKLPKIFAGNPAAVVLALFLAATVAVIGYSQFYDPEPAKAIILQEKRAAQQKRIEALQQKLKEKRLQKNLKGPDIFNEGKSKVPKLKEKSDQKTPFGSGIFSPNNLNKVAPGAETPVPKPVSPFGSVFDPGNLNKVAPKE